MTENFHDKLCRLAAMSNEARVHD
ncbi:protein YrbN [Pectobacterium atrosepticum]